MVAVSYDSGRVSVCLMRFIRLIKSGKTGSLGCFLATVTVLVMRVFIRSEWVRCAAWRVRMRRVSLAFDITCFHWVMNVVSSMLTGGCRERLK